MQKIIAQESRQIILGHWAENEAVCVEFDITGWEERYGAGGHFDVLAKRQGDADYYPCHTQREGNKVLWFISSADTAVVGQGSCGLVYRVGNVVAKSAIFTTVVTEGVTNGGEVPEPWEDWTDSVLQAGAKIQQSAIDVSDAAASAAQSAFTAGSAASLADDSATAAAGSASVASDSAIAAANSAASAGSAASAAATAQAGAEAVLTALEDTDAEAITLVPGAQATAEWETDSDTGARTLVIGVPAGAAGVGAVHYDEAQSLTDEQQGQARTNIGLGNVDNTSDANKPVSIAQQSALDLKADKTALNRTDRSLEYLWKKSKGILYDTETVHSNDNTVTVPSGAMEYASMDKIGGKTLVFNQLVQNGNFEDATAWSGNGATISTANNKITAVAVIERGTIGIYVPSGYRHNFKADHKYYLHLYVTIHGSVGSSGHIYSGFSDNAIERFISQGERTLVEAITYPMQTREQAVIAYFSNLNIGEDISVENYIVADLTQMFGTGNEPETVEEVRAILPLDYYPYTTGALISTAVDKVVSKKADTTTITEKTIPQAVISLCPDYGQGTAGSFNYIDFAEKKYHHKGSMDNSGVWTELATEEIIDLSSVIPEDFEILPVEAEGTLQFHYPELGNGYLLDIPNDVTYMVNVAEVTV